MKQYAKAFTWSWLAFSVVAPVWGGPVLMNEIMYHPMSEDSLEEYIELFNAGTNTVNLAGWRFVTGVRFAFPEVTIAPGAFLVVAANEAAFTNKYPAVKNYVAGWDGILSNSGQLIELTDAQEQRQDSVRYADDGDWAVRVRNAVDFGHAGWTWQAEHDGLGKSLELINPALPNKYGQNWSASDLVNGTPGRANSVVRTNLAPILFDAQHFPLVPRSTDPVTITARILDEQNDGVTVEVHHRLDTAAIFVVAPMIDDGLHGDGIAGDGVYGAVLPAQANDSIVEFYIEARDANGRTRTWPGAALQSDGSSAQNANALYQVDDSPNYAGNQPVYRLILTAADQAELKQINGNSPPAPFPTTDQTRSHASFNSTFISFDGTGTELRYLVGVRNRGNGSRARRPQSYKVDFRQDQLWKKTAGINLNTQYSYAQIAGSAIFRRSGVAASEARPVQVRVNNVNLCAPDVMTTGSPAYGYYAHVESWDSDLALRQFPNDSSGNLYRGIRLVPPGANLSYQGESSTPYRENYFKFSNTSADDWTDLIELTRVLNYAPDTNYTAEVNRVIDVEEWMRYFAINTLLVNNETCLANGDGDDYYLYRGVVDSRFKVLPWDLDTIMGQGDTPGSVTASLFRMAESNPATGGFSPAMNRFVKWPDFAPIYYQSLKELIDTTFSAEQLNPLLDQTLAGLVPDSTLASMKSFAAQRGAYVLSQMPLSLNVASDLASLNGYPHTTVPAIALSGSANVIDTRSVFVNGQVAEWSAWDGQWSIGGVALKPGINRVMVQSLDARGQAFAQTNIDVWYDDGTVQQTGGVITADTTWTAAGGPYQLTTNLTVASGARLTLEPGTTVYLASGVNLTVANGGRLLAEGTTNAPIRFARAPGDTASWGSLTINGSVGSPETRIAYTYLGGNGNTCIEVAGGTLYLDHTSFGTTTHQYVSLDNSSFLISNCVFPASTAPFELLHGTGGIKSGGRGIVRECFFGSTTGYSDIVDFTGGNRDLNQPIIQFYNNVFVGASDDMLDLDGTDAWIEGNIFLHAHKNGPPDSSSAISGGDNNGNTSELTLIGNLFFDCDQAATAKQGNFFTLLNNTIVRTTRNGGLDTAAGVVNVQDVSDAGEPTAFAKGFYLEGNIIVDAEQLVRHYDSLQTSVTFNNNILPFAWSGPGNGNRVVDPLLKHIPQLSETFFTSWEQAQVMRDWFSLLPGSPALGTGPNGRDIGGVVLLGAYLTGEPTGTNNQTTATLTVGINRNGSGIPTAGFPEGSGYSHYQWRLDGGAWSAETPIATPITLIGLGNGPHRVEVVGKRDSGWYQDDPAFGPEAVITTSHTWTVDTNTIPPVGSGLVINEILAKNDSVLPRGATYPDLIELFNNGDSARDLSGLGLTDDANTKYKFTFPTGTMLAPGGFLLVYADTAAGPSELHSGFTLKQSGGALYLFDKTADGGALLDSVEFGLQLADLSVGRLADGAWALTLPTFGSPNVAYPLGDARRLRINEWLADARSTLNSGFIELYNPDPVPVNLGGLYLTDNPIGAPTNYVIAPLSFIAAGGFAVFKTDQQPEEGADHLNFTLLPEQGEIGLLGANGDEIDVVLYRSQIPDVSEGRSPSGANRFAAFTQPTPGAGNPGIISNTNVTSVAFDLIAITNNWKYYESGDAGAGWNTTAFDDSAWPSGPALLYHEPDSLPAPKNTALTLGMTTYYFRTHFAFDLNAAGVTLKMTTVIDDGAIVYLNGVEVYRLGMPIDAVGYSAFANQTVNDANYEGPFEIPATSLVQGDNVLAVETHQVNATSSDIVFGMTLIASFLITNNSSAIQLPVVLNEVLAESATLTNAAGVITDWVELYNPNTNAVDLADMSLSEDSTTPRKWVFPSGSRIPAQGFLVIEFNGDASVSATNTGFGLNSTGGAVYLFDTSGLGGALVDGVTYGLQVADYSIGRIPSGTGQWTLSLPTRSAANVATALGDPSALRINEWMADPSSDEDWFEIYNLDTQPVELSGLFLTDDLNNRTQNLIPALSFVGSGANGYVKFAADGAPDKGPDHVNFKLGAKGESLGLFSANGVALDSITFGPQQVDVSQGRLPDGATTLVSFPNTATPGEGNYLPLTNVVINEVLTHTDPPLEDAIELYNPALSPADISGWYLSNTPDNLKKFRIPVGTMIPAGAYKVFYEYEFNPNPGSSTSFTLNSAHGDDLNISTADSTGKLNGYRARQKFGAAENGVSFGRYRTSVGVDFVAMSQRTFGVENPATLAAFRTGKGNPNAYPKMGPVILSEIMFHPPDIGGTNAIDNTLDEFIELQNITADLAPLYDPAAVTNTWKIDGGISYAFPMNVSLPPGAHLLLVNFDPASNPTQLAAFRGKYAVSAAVPIYGPYSGKLNNSGDRIDLLKPDSPQLPPHPDAGFVPYVLVEQVKYSAVAPWPAGADGTGLSFQRKSATEYGNDPVDWKTGVPTAGRDNVPDIADSDGDGLPDTWEIANGLRPDSAVGDDGALGDPDRDAMTNLREYLSGTDPKNAGSALRFEGVNWSGTGLKLSFTAVAGKGYTVQYRDSLSEGGWNKLRDVEVQSVTQPMEITDTAVLGSNGRYYRLVTPRLL